MYSCGDKVLEVVVSYNFFVVLTDDEPRLISVILRQWVKDLQLSLFAGPEIGWSSLSKPRRRHSFLLQNKWMYKIRRNGVYIKSKFFRQSKVLHNCFVSCLYSDVNYELITLITVFYISSHSTSNTWSFLKLCLWTRKIRTVSRLIYVNFITQEIMKPIILIHPKLG